MTTAKPPFPPGSFLLSLVRKKVQLLDQTNYFDIYSCTKTKNITKKPLSIHPLKTFPNVLNLNSNPETRKNERKEATKKEKKKEKPRQLFKKQIEGWEGKRLLIDADFLRVPTTASSFFSPIRDRFLNDQTPPPSKKNKKKKKKLSSFYDILEKKKLFASNTH